MITHHRSIAFAVLVAGTLPSLAVALPRSFACSGQANCVQQIADADAGMTRQTVSALTLGAAACDGAAATVSGVSVDIVHGSVGDLILELVPPAGLPVRLLDRPMVDAGVPGSCHGDDVLARFGASGPVQTCSASSIPAVTGAMRASGNLGTLTGLASTGVWQLRINDSESGGYGLLRDWTLHLECAIDSQLFADGFE